MAGQNKAPGRERPAETPVLPSRLVRALMNVRIHGRGRIRRDAGHTGRMYEAAQVSAHHHVVQTGHKSLQVIHFRVH